MSRSAFAARFHEKVGEPALHYIARWRMQHAARLLTDTPTQLAEIARAVGYRSEAAFTRAFTRYVGVTRGRFRRRAATHPS
jgi:AraC-like DNA-binding protein